MNGIYAKLLRAGLALVMLAAGLAAIANFDRMGLRFHALGAPDWLRYLVGLVQVAAAILLWVPGRVGYGAALSLLIACAATLAHVTVLGWDSAPPAIALGVIAGLVLRRHRADLRR